MKRRLAADVFFQTNTLSWIANPGLQLNCYKPIINTIRNHPASISNIAKATHRKVEAIRRDVREMESVGIVKTYTEINATGHGRHKVVKLAAPTLKLEAFI